MRELGRIGVLMGGYSSEREISLKSGEAVYNALADAGCLVTSIDIQDKEEEKILKEIKAHKIDVAFIALHGKLGEDGTIQSILEQAAIPYTGSNIQASRMAINKAQTQMKLKEHGINVPPYKIIQANENVVLPEIIKQLGGLPVVVKPACEGSSIGVSIVREEGLLGKAVALARGFGHEILVEKFIPGREMTVGILDQQALPVIEVRPKSAFFDFDAKYKSGTTEYIVPAEISEELSLRLQEIALKSYQALGCEDLSRIDFMVGPNDEPFVLEVNTIPGFTSTSLLPKAAKLIGLNFNDLCLRLVQLAYEKKGKKPS